MTLKQLLRVLNQYDNMLEGMGHKPERSDTSLAEVPFAAMPKVLAHARWMCEQAIGFIPRHKVGDEPPSPDPMAKEKAMRWLGFIQGVLWTTGARTIDEMRADNTSP